MNIDLESAFINKYVVKNKRQRYLGFIETPKRRRTFLEMLYHGRDFDKSNFEAVAGFFETEIRKRIAGSPTASCYMISVDPALDGREMPTNEALAEITAYTEGIVLIFEKGELVYYRGEPPHNEYLSI